jgi:hypothetical protein
VPVVLLDLDKIETFAPALQGIDRLFMATGYTVDMLRQSKDLVNMAKRAGVKQIVHLGACGDNDTRVAHYGWHQFIEPYIEWSGVLFTIFDPRYSCRICLGMSYVRQGVIRHYVGDARLSWVDCGALFQIQIEGGKAHGSGLRIELTGFEGDLIVQNDRAFATKRSNVLEGATRKHPEWAALPIPESYSQIPDSTLDMSVQDLAHLYAAFALDGREGKKSAPDFAGAVRLHRLIDAIYCSSATGKSIDVRHPQ